MSDPSTDVSVARIMREIEQDVRLGRRTRLVARGGPDEYQDPLLYEAVEAILQRAVDGRDPDVLLLPELLGDDREWALQTPLRFASHRGVVGKAIVFVKRRLLLPAMRWLFEYSLENFRRQQRINRILFACVEELAIENARLRRELFGPPGP